MFLLQKVLKVSGWNIPNVDGVVAFPRKEEVKENKRGSCCSNDDEIRHYKQPCVVEDSLWGGFPRRKEQVLDVWWKQTASLFVCFVVCAAATMWWKKVRR